MNYQLDRLKQLAPQAPDELLQAARSQAAARSSNPVSRSRRRAPAFVVSVLAGLLLAFTPPGRAATGWVADVAGFGEEPTLPQSRTVEGSARVVANGALEDGSRYEVVAKQVKGVGAQSVCFSIDWIDLQEASGDSFCTHSAHTGRGNDPPLETSGVAFPPGSEKGPALFFGIADSEEITTVEAQAVGRDGTTPLESNVTEISGVPLEAVGGSFPVTLFFVEIARGLVDSVRAGDNRVIAVARDGDGAKVDQAAAFIQGSRKEVVAQEGVAFPASIPKQLESFDDLDPAPLSADERERLLDPGWEGAVLSEAIELFSSQPEVEQLERRATDAIKRRIGERGPGLLLQTGALRTSAGEIAYFVTSQTFQDDEYVGIYSVDDLRAIYFGPLREP